MLENVGANKDLVIEFGESDLGIFELITYKKNHETDEIIGVQSVKMEPVDFMK